ncbi:MAG TPA: ATP-binding protein, partial [Steroidobacteraceae bacterium]|nr:ATP-binding protein [Steroidobacteraceae bacterium]
MQSFVVTESSEIAQARRAVAALAGRQGLNEADAGRAALAAVEICSNMVKHGGGGELIAQPLERGGQRGVGLVGLDKGPGIDDLAKCLRDGFSTGGSPGTGLGAIRRTAQMFDVYSRPGHGTVVVAQLWPGGREPHAAMEIGAIVIPAPYEVECGDTWCYVERAGGALAMGVDGLGHGLGAAQAANLACEVFMTEMTRPPGMVLERIHTTLRTTRGAAAILLEIDWNQRRLLAAGIGNMVAAIVD